MPERMTLGEAAMQLGCQWHHLKRLSVKGKIPFQKIGRYRAVLVADFDVIREQLRLAKYPVREESAVATC